VTTFIRIFLLVVGNALALLLALLALETTPTNFLGWFLLAVALMYGAGGVIYLWIDRDHKKAVRMETGNRSFWWILPGFLAVFFAPPLEFLHLQPVLPRGLGWEIAGLLVILLGLAVRVWTRSTIKGAYSGYLQVTASQTLVKSGPYRWVRHPGYAGFVLMALGMALGYSSWIGLAAVPLLLIPGLAYRMRAEEGLLIERFGEAYRTYARTTPRLIPWVW
jgi:protein-S-isoprenylcysteine O-methyltransferase Ste14